MLTAGFIYLGLIALIPRLKSHQHVLWMLLIPGILLRVIIFPAAPIQEDDFYRYLWDGGVTAEGFNPYTTAPAELLPSPFLGSESDPVPNSPLQDLAEDAGPEIVGRINYPYVKTIYPPVAQAAFALSYKIKAWSLTTWRSVLLVVEAISLLLLLVLLKSFSKNPLWAAVYWWNPLVISETINAAHMDVLLLPALLATILFLQQKRPFVATLALAVATAVKLWPALLIAPLLHSLSGTSHKTKVILFMLFGFCCALLLSPQLISAVQESAAGVRVYGESWQTNAFLFDWLVKGLYVLPFSMDTELIARLLVALSVSAIALYPICRICKNAGLKNTESSAEQFILHSLWVTAALFLLSPTGYPWYILWFVGFLVFRLNPALLLLTATLPLYDLRYYLAAIDQEIFWGPLNIAVQFLPICLLLIWQGYRIRSVKNHA